MPAREVNPMRKHQSIEASIPPGFARWIRRHDLTIREAYKDSDGYWLYLQTGYCWDDQGLHTIHEQTVSRCIQAFPRVGDCHCQDCQPTLTPA